MNARRNRRMRIVSALPASSSTPVNAGETLSVVASDNTVIARAMSILVGIVGHPGRLTPEQARDVVAWAEGATA